MNTCIVVDTNTNWTGAGGVLVGDTGFGVLGSEIPSTGDAGPAYAYNDLPAGSSGKQVAGAITAWPTAGTLVPNEDTSFTYTRTSGTGTDSFTYQLYLDGQPSGSPITDTLSVGIVNATAPGGTMTGLGTISGGTVTGGGATGTSSGNGTAPGTTMSGGGSMSGGAATGSASAPGTAMSGGGSVAGGAANSFVPPLPVNPAMLYSMPGNGWNFPPIVVGDVATLSYDFKEDLPTAATITGATPSIVLHAGVDPNPAAMIVAGPTISGSIVSIQVHSFVAGCAYHPRITATFNDGQVITYPWPGEGSLSVVA